MESKHHREGSAATPANIAAPVLCGSFGPSVDCQLSGFSRCHCSYDHLADILADEYLVSIGLSELPILICGINYILHDRTADQVYLVSPITIAV